MKQEERGHSQEGIQLQRIIENEGEEEGVIIHQLQMVGSQVQGVPIDNGDQLMRFDADEEEGEEEDEE